ncbi:MAG: hypothetical protein JXA67_05370 [Micromonosporaceae bacterium]|nr:hypothetical protein [Micromonosporaceae bacterium]
MARLRTRIARAAVLHQQAAAATGAAARLIQSHAPVNAASEQHAEQRVLAARLRATATQLTPGWLGAPLDALPATTPLGGSTMPTFVRIGLAHPLDDASFPAIIPFLQAGHIAIDGDARDHRVAGLLQALMLRLLAAAPAGALRIRVVDGAEIGTTFDSFRGVGLAPSATSHAEVRRLLTEAEQWIANRPGDVTGPTMLLVIASLPELTDGTDLARIASLAKAGPAGRLHLIAAGWPPPPLTAETTQMPLAHCTQITLRNPYAWIGDPPGATFSASRTGRSRLNAPVDLDTGPPPALIVQACDELRIADGKGQGPGDSRSRHPEEPVPDLVAWREYVLAAQRLDAARNEASARIAEHTAMHVTAVEDFKRIQGRLSEQATRLRETAFLAGLPRPGLVPDQALVGSGWDALARIGTPPAAITSALRGAHSLLDAADVALSGDDDDSSSAWITKITLVGFFALIAVVSVVGLLLLTQFQAG